jgi:hypothetical protein
LTNNLLSLPSPYLHYRSKAKSWVMNVSPHAKDLWLRAAWRRNRVDGVQCGSPALRGEGRCYFHDRWNRVDLCAVDW